MEIEKEKEDMEEDRLSQLPEDCICRIIASTPAKDACRVAAVSRLLRSISNSDPCWKPRLHSDIQQIISQSTPPSPSPEFLNSLSGKDLFLHLSDNPIFLATGNTRYGLEKESGSVCYMKGARDLKIVWSDTPSYWYWESSPISRFPEVAMLDHVWWLEIVGIIEAKKLTKKTKYAGYFVFNLTDDSMVFERKPVRLQVYVEGDEPEECRVLLEPPEDAATHIREREDGWKEVKMGEIYNDFEDDVSIIFKLHELASSPFQGLIVEGIEIRPAN